MANIKLIAIDLDGTLLNSASELEQENIDALMRAVDKDIHIVLSSGRSWFLMQKIAKLIGLPHENYIISCNGASIRYIDDMKEIYNNKINVDLANSLLDMIGCHGEIMIFYDSIIDVMRPYDTFYHDDSDIKQYFIEIPNQSKYFIKEDIYKITFKTDNKYDFNNLMDKFKKRYNNLVDVFHMQGVFGSNNFFVEIMKKNVDKSTALAKILKQQNWTFDEVMAIGDNTNDIKSLQLAKIGVAMENSIDEVKQYADFVTLTNDQNGVSHTIKKFCL